jgi:exopolysaccharide production protein ExoQ
MGKMIATVFFVLLIWQLYRWTRDDEHQTSIALWLPTFWFFIGSSRNISEWLYGSSSAGADRYLQGSPLDRAILSLVMALGVMVLLARAQRVGRILRSNFPILLYFSYCVISVLWSDFPDVAFKRWFRALGDVVMVLIVLTDPDWVAALKRLLTRLGNVLIPLSVLFSRWYPQYGREFSHGGTPYWSGVTPEKNALGSLCMVFGLAFLYYFLQIYREENAPHRKGQIIGRGLVLVMTVYLLFGSHSATALAGFVLASVPMVLTVLYRGARRPIFMHTMVLGALGFAAGAVFLNIGSWMLEDLGRNSTLTGRTAVWQAALRLAQSPVVGTGFESFWLGPRVYRMTELVGFNINQAHNGYLEVYLNLGWIGVALVALVLITAYSRVVKAVRWMSPAACLGLAYLMIVITENFTEASFGMAGPVWMGFLMTTMAMSEAPRQRELSPLGLGPAGDLEKAEEELAGVAVPARKQIAHSVGRNNNLVRERLQ